MKNGRVALRVTRRKSFSRAGRCSSVRGDHAGDAQTDSTSSPHFTVEHSSAITHPFFL